MRAALVHARIGCGGGSRYVRCLGGRAAFVFTLDIKESVAINVCSVKSFPAPGL